MSTPNFFVARLDQMIDPKHPLAVLATRMPWAALEKALTPKPDVAAPPAAIEKVEDLFGTHERQVGVGDSAAGRPRLPLRLMLSLLYLKHAYNLSDEAVVERWSENVVW
jgi:transposase, IS5 family